MIRERNKYLLFEFRIRFEKILYKIKSEVKDL